jgi:hypothetical protein
MRIQIYLTSPYTVPSARRCATAAEQTNLAYVGMQSAVQYSNAIKQQVN